jgi:hypothetical protein
LTLVRRTARNTRAILCSHALMEIQSVCANAKILNRRTMVASSTVAEVIGRTQPKVIQRSGIRLLVTPQAIGEAQRQLEGWPNVVYRVSGLSPFE